MGEKRESDEFEEDDVDEAVGSDDPDLDHLFKDLERQKRRGGPKGGEPAWRRLEKYMEQKRTAELLSDFDDYEIEEGGSKDAGGRAGSVEAADDAADPDEDEPATRRRERSRSARRP
jgi:hypothetical protein